MTSTYAIQLLSGAVHNATPQNPDLEVRKYYLMHLWSTWGVPKDMRDNAEKWYREYKKVENK